MLSLDVVQLTACTSLLLCLIVWHIKMPAINTNLDELLYLQNCDLLWDDESLFFQKTAEFQGLKLLFQRESPYSMR